MNQTACAVFLVTASSEEEAKKIAHLLLEKRKAACVNIVPGVISSYWWKGKLESASESLLIIKSKASLADEIVEMVKSVHSYQVPEIVALPIIAGNPDYLAWIGDEVRGG
ncbi:MAG: divalent-cation tolerance protein CutA [Dehalococcoidia bacterium]|nr:divalent-cation tolerance protein CutA [Dehalococcoidia bacterium]